MPLTAKQAAARAGAIGASEVGGLMGDYLHPWATPASIYARVKLGVERTAGAAASAGQRLEPWILDEARRELGVRVRTTSWTYHHPRLPLVATADAVTLDEPIAVVEAKYVTAFGESAWTAGPPPWVVDQVQVQLLLSRRPLAVVVAFFGARAKVARYDIPADWERQRAIVEAVEAFTREHLEPGIPPAVTEPRDMDYALTFAALSDGELEASGELLDAIERLDRAAHARLAAEGAEELERVRVLRLMADAGASVVLPPYGHPAAWRATAVQRGATRSLRFLPSRRSNPDGI